MKDFPPTLAVRAASCALRRCDDTIPSLLDTPPAEHREGTPGVDEDARCRRLVPDNWNRGVEEIWKVEGFGHFLLQSPLFSHLQDAACDAIIIPHKQPPTSIQLPINLDKLVRLVNTLRQTVEKEAGSRGTQPGLMKVSWELRDDVVCLV
ncbi:uncharacterized protein EDB91DRAFT_1251723 [Suillus paluster]|uniref:uncharacterized protein n=1 Tax=Suillus paluster TaxID=48578 RepID=UPI001B883E0C|nr:uncharacterized protein EDB91DRAFT_1251723 [Suillus paluster]KAG1732680.1 hypothetical protein EDB91DRAFT_1251723 [Suillus paluster]